MDIVEVLYYSLPRGGAYDWAIRESCRTSLKTRLSAKEFERYDKPEKLARGGLSSRFIGPVPFRRIQELRVLLDWTRRS